MAPNSTHTHAQMQAQMRVHETLRLLCLLGNAWPTLQGYMMSAREMSTTAAFVHPCCTGQCSSSVTADRCALCVTQATSILETVHLAYVATQAAINARIPGTLPRSAAAALALPRTNIWLSPPGGSFTSLREWWLSELLPAASGFSGADHHLSGHQEALYGVLLGEFIDMPQILMCTRFAFG
jgi:hypothetical protein